MAIYSEPGELGSKAPEFSLVGVDDRTYSLDDFKDSKALVVIFMCNHCPYVQAVRKRINQLAKSYKSRGVDVVAINSNDTLRYPEDSFEMMKQVARHEEYAFPFLLDETQEVAKSYRAVCTPDFYVYTPDSRSDFILKYRGRLDDNWKDENAVTKRDLSLALDDILDSREPHTDQKPSMGCSIKWKASRAV